MDYVEKMVQRHDHLYKPSLGGVRWGTFAALVTWAIFTWDKPDRVIFPTLVSAVIFAVCLFVERKRTKL